MKKILLLLLSLTLVFGCLMSCGNNGGGGNTNGGATAEKGTVEYIAGIVSASTPTKIVTHVSYIHDDYSLPGIYTTEIDRLHKNSQFSFEFDRLAIPGEDESDDYIKTESGVVQFREGEVLRSEGSDWETLGEGYLTLSLSIVKSMFTTFEISEDGFNLIATVSAQNTERVFGSAIDAEGDITLEIATNGTYLYNVKVSYVAKDPDAVVTVETSYEYAPVTFDF